MNLAITPLPTTPRNGFTLVELSVVLVIIGFTLVELSIVLVIIGLILGAILLGRDLIKAAEIRAAISELSSIQTALVMFEEKYEAMPGDMNNATTYWPGVTSDGDGNGFFGGGGTDIAKDQEGGYFWHHLGLSGLYKSFKRPDAANFSDVPGVNTPQILPGTAAVGQRRTSGEMRYGTMSNYIQLAKYNNITTGAVRCAIVDAVTAYSIDTKTDNGNPSSGKVLAYETSTCSPAPPRCTDYIGGGYDYMQTPGSLNYDLDNTTGLCRMAFLIFD